MIEPQPESRRRDNLTVHAARIARPRRNMLSGLLPLTSSSSGCLAILRRHRYLHLPNLAYHSNVALGSLAASGVHCLTRCPGPGNQTAWKPVALRPGSAMSDATAHVALESASLISEPVLYCYEACQEIGCQSRSPRSRMQSQRAYRVHSIGRQE
ncbi:hypothetical protein BU16DRAFT_532644 [Lophium mytilinum]|uniref:Uncharacterized protein n=1 Tax=Lophium mytilinum TaxID=390894 RepID=A0A6A6RD03_9PEZI|nr:hypothetical protein BU16DRAFT_532644 [Lophium mytilinum]